jgi:hypothetical protein
MRAAVKPKQVISKGERLMRKTFMKLVAVVGVASVVLALALPASAADKAEKKTDKTYAGVVVDVKDNVLSVRTVKSTTKVTKAFKVDENTKCTDADGAAVTLADLKAGTKVEITYTKDKDVMTATAVGVKAAPKKK